MAVIKSGATSDQLTIDPTSKAARASQYASDGAYRGPKATYRAATAAVLVAPASAASFFIIEGSASKTIRLQRALVSGMTLTAVAYGSVQLEKYSTAATGGTATLLTQVPLDSTFPGGTSNRVAVFTAAPTDGTLVGTLGSIRTLMQATTAVASGVLVNYGWDLRSVGDCDTAVLRGITQYIAMSFIVAPATAVSMSLEVEWTEE